MMDYAALCRKLLPTVTAGICKHLQILCCLYRALWRKGKPTKCMSAIILFSHNSFYMFRALEAHHQEGSCNNTGFIVCVSTQWWCTIYHTRTYILYHNAYLPDDGHLKLETCRRYCVKIKLLQKCVWLLYFVYNLQAFGWCALNIADSFAVWRTHIDMFITGRFTIIFRIQFLSFTL